MRIAMVSEHASPLAVLGEADAGGQNVYVAALAQQLVERGHEVVVHTRRDDPALDDVIPLGGVRVDHLDAGPAAPLPKDDLLPFVPAMGDELRKRWSAEPPDLVHAHFWMSGLAALQAARPLGIPVVQTFHALGVVKRRHQGVADTSPAGRIDLERQILASVDAVIATCRDERTELLALGADGASITVVPCGIDPAQFGPRGTTWRRGARPRLVSIGRLVPRKGVEDVLRALALLPEPELVVAGGPPRAELPSDPEYRRLRDLCEDLGVRDRVRFVGGIDRPDVAALMRSADVAVCVPWYEPFGIVPVEAMACGTPVVGSAVGGLLDTVIDGVTGRLVAPRQPRQLAVAIAELLVDRRARRRMGASAAVHASRFSWRRVTEEIEAVYARVAAEVPSR
jgi:D-inositol-3-phosphate glycosyltransferase